MNALIHRAVSYWEGQIAREVNATFSNGVVSSIRNCDCKKKSEIMPGEMSFTWFRFPYIWKYPSTFLKIFAKFPYISLIFFFHSPKCDWVKITLEWAVLLYHFTYFVCLQIHLWPSIHTYSSRSCPISQWHLSPHKPFERSCAGWVRGETLWLASILYKIAPESSI